MSTACRQILSSFKFRIISLSLLFFVTAVGAALSQPIPFAQSAGGSGGGNALSEDANKGTSMDVRLNYFKRFPYAKYASEKELGGEDILVPVDKSSGANIKQSKGKFDESKSTPIAKVKAYEPVVKFCDDNPQKGICYMQPLLIATDSPCTFRDLELFKTALTGVHGMPLSDTQFQILDRENKQRFLELLFDPERFLWLATNTGQLQGAGGANSFAGVAENTFDNAYDRIIQGDSGSGGGSGGSGGGGGGGGALINVANENAAVRTSAQNMNKTVPQAVYMVLKMYHFVFVPIAILLLLPGAVITHTKSMVSRGFGVKDDDASSPFEGPLRALIAVFLIPATQLIVSYAIDIGNSMALSVQPWINRDTVFSWAHQQSYNTRLGMEENVVQLPVGGTTAGGQQIPSANSSGGGGGGGGGGGDGGGVFNLNIFGGGTIGSAANGVINNFLNATLGSVVNGILDLFSVVSGIGGQGKAADMDENQVIPERQLWLSQIMQLAFNAAEYAMSYMIIVLTGYQLVIMCYLLLLGPIAACFFAWPTGVGKLLFRGVFTKWLNGVVALCLWRFYWCVILAVMTQRIIFLQQNGGFNPHNDFEMMVFTCFLGMMLVVPFQPFQFDPGAVASDVLQKGGEMAKGMGHSMQVGAKEGGMPAAQQQQLAQALQPMMSTADSVERTGIGIANVENREGLERGYGERQAKQAHELASAGPPAASSSGDQPGAPSSAGSQAPGAPPVINAPSVTANVTQNQAASLPQALASTQAQDNPAIAAVQSAVGPGSSVEPIGKGEPVMNPLTPPPGGTDAYGTPKTSAADMAYRINTMDPAQAQAGLRNIQQLAVQAFGPSGPPSGGPPPGGPPAGGGPPASGPPSGGPPSGGPPAGGPPGGGPPSGGPPAGGPPPAAPPAGGPPPAAPPGGGSPPPGPSSKPPGGTKPPPPSSARTTLTEQLIKLTFPSRLTPQCHLLLDSNSYCFS